MKNVKIIGATHFFLSCFVLAFLSISCSNSSNESKKETKICIEPENPYEEATGHYAGYNWAQSNEQSCDGNSESFNEGCDEYYNQLDSYKACLKHS